MNRIRKVMRKQSDTPSRASNAQAQELTRVLMPTLNDTLHHYDDPFAAPSSLPKSSPISSKLRRLPLRSISTPLHPSTPPIRDDVPALSRSSTDTVLTTDSRTVSPVAVQMQILPHSVRHWEMLDCEIAEYMSERKTRERAESILLQSPSAQKKMPSKTFPQPVEDSEDELDTFGVDLSLFPMPPASPPTHSQLSSPSPLSSPSSAYRSSSSYRSLKVTKRPISPPISRQTPHAAVDEWGSVVHSSPSQFMAPNPLRLVTTNRAVNGGSIDRPASDRRNQVVPVRPQRPAASSQTMPLRTRAKHPAVIAVANASRKPPRPPRGPRPPLFLPAPTQSVPSRLRRV